MNREVAATSPHPSIVPHGPIVVVSQRLGPLGPEEGRLEAHGVVVRSEPLWSADQIASRAADAAVVILGAVEPMDESAMVRLPRLCAVVRRGVGYDNVDARAATRLGIVVANVPDASVQEVSDHALALLLSMERAIPWLNEAVHRGLWAHDPRAIDQVRHASRRIGELTLGVVGLGRIGQAMVTKSRSLYARTVAADPYVDSARAAQIGVELVDLETLLAMADHISLHVPLRPATERLIAADALAIVRPGAILVNTSRGGLIDEGALVEALNAGGLRAAGLDVTRNEPLEPGDPLLSCDRLLLTAHSAATSETASSDLAARSVDAALAIITGKHPTSVVNPAVLSSTALRSKKLATDAKNT